MIDVFVLNFKAMILAHVKVRKRDFLIVLAPKQQKCQNRAPVILSEFWIQRERKLEKEIRKGNLEYQIESICTAKS